MSRNRQSSFKGKVLSNAKKTESSGYGYLILPDGVKIYAPKIDTQVKLDFIPYEITDVKHPDHDDQEKIAMVGDLWWKRPFKKHSNIGASKDTVVCLQSVGKRCPICEYRDKRMKEGVDKKELDALNYSRRILYIVVPLNSKEHDAEPHIMDMAFGNFQKPLTKELKFVDEKYEEFPDIENGYTIEVRWDSETFGDNKPYAKAGRFDFRERRKQYSNSILDKVPNLDEVLRILSYDELMAKFMEEDVEEDGGRLKDDEREHPTDRKRKSAEATRRTPEPEPEVPTWDEIEEMKIRQLRAIIEDQGLTVDETDYDLTDKDQELNFRKAIAEELEIDIPRKSKPSNESHSERTNKPQERTRTSERSERTSRREPEKGKCPFGHKFGTDLDKFPDCDKCKMIDDCIDYKE